ncbi:MAG: alpha/beta fold hydrolase [Leucobacter sp.]
MRHIEVVSERALLASGTTMHYLRSGSGSPVVLIHGFPQTSTCWASVIPHLAEHHTVIAPDLRGLGASSLPSDAAFDKKTLAAEVASLLVDHLGMDSFHVVGHDWGGVVAFSIAAHHPEFVRSLSVVDVAVPSTSLPDMAQGGHRWHHGFHNAVSLPEALVKGREDLYVGWFFDNFGLTAEAISPEHRAEYAEAYSQPHSLSAGFELYRTTEQDRLDITAATVSTPVEVPVLAVGGSGEWGRGTEVRESLIPLVKGDVHERIITGAGHWVPDEQPEELAEELLQHFGRARA